MNKPKVAFICVHNSCRSQMAEAISRLLASDAYEAYSAGTEVRDRINEDAAAIVKELYGIDMTVTQRPKLLAELPPVDVVVTMGCEVNCPFLPARHREDWGVADPTGKDHEAFVQTAKTIGEKVLDLKERIHTII